MIMEARDNPIYDCPYGTEDGRYVATIRIDDAVWVSPLVRYLRLHFQAFVASLFPYSSVGMTVPPRGNPM